MNASALSQVVDQTFPKLDQELRKEITQKVTVHFFETMKEQVFASDPEGLQDFENQLTNESDENKRSALYGKRIVEKLLSLPAGEQERIDKLLEKELVTVLHDLYKTYDGAKN